MTEVGITWHFTRASFEPGPEDILSSAPHVVPHLGEPLEENPVPTTARRWHVESEEWIRRKRATQGTYLGRSGDNVARCLSRWGRLLAEMGRQVSPEAVTQEDLMVLLPLLGEAPKTVRVSLGWLGSFLAAHGNRVVQDSGIAKRFEAIPTSGRRRWLTADQLEAVMTLAVGTERIVVALEGFQGLRRIEVMRARLCDLSLTSNPPTMGIRGKGHGDTVSRVVPLASRVLMELGSYLPTRAMWAVEGSDSPYLLVHKGTDGKLHPYKEATPIDRMVRRAGDRIGIKLSNHDLRRTFGRVLRNLGADLMEVRDLYGHASVEMTEHYIGAQTDRMATAIRLLDAPVRTTMGSNPKA